MGLVNIHGNRGLGNLQRDHWLFLAFRHMGPPVVLKVEYTGPKVFTMYSFKGAKDYFEVLAKIATRFQRLGRAEDRVP